MADIAGLGAFVGHVMDFAGKMVDLYVTRERRQRENEKLQLENESLQLDNWMKLQRLVHVARVEPSGPIEIDDVLAVEEPLEIRVHDEPVSVTMRTPGHDLDLAAGFLLTESIVRDADEVESLRNWDRNVVRATLRRQQRRCPATFSRGVCGEAVIDALRARTTPLAMRLRVEYDAIAGMPAQLRGERRPFEVTGGVHAAGIFSADGTMLRVREDIGYHNAVRKVIGSYFREGAVLDDAVLVVSGRAEFDIVRMAIVARIPVLVAAGAPSTLAVELAQAFGLKLYGMAHDGRFTVY